MSGQALSIVGDGAETRDWTYVGDIGKCLLTIGEREDHRVIDMASLVVHNV